MIRNLPLSVSCITGVWTAQSQKKKMKIQMKMSFPMHMIMKKMNIRKREILQRHREMSEWERRFQWQHSIAHVYLLCACVWRIVFKYEYKLYFITCWYCQKLPFLWCAGRELLQGQLWMFSCGFKSRFLNSSI